MAREIGWGQTDILLYQIKQAIKAAAQAGTPVQRTSTTTTSTTHAPTTTTTTAAP